MTTSDLLVRSVALCYPTESLTRQVARWGRKHADCAIEPVFGRTALALRHALDGADAVVIDASDDHAQAIEAFSQAIARFGARRVVVYTEQMHEGLELFVRTHGAWLLLGPLDGEPWEDLFSRMLPPAAIGHAWRRAA